VKLKPCLFCGEVEAMRIQRTPGGRWYAVVCGNCWASGAYDQTRSGAARWWNGAGAAEREACVSGNIGPDMTLLGQRTK